MSLNPQTRYTVDEYLTLERSTEVRHDFLDGEVFAMTGASYAHNLVVANIVGELRNQLRAGPCTVVANDQRVRAGLGRLYTYPDIVVCSSPKIEQPGDTLVNPSVILEVLSDATEAYDRGKKFEHYRAIESLSDYLLVSQDRFQIERFSRDAGGRWIYSVASGSGASMAIESIGCVLTVGEAFSKVDGVSEPDVPQYG